MMNDRPLTLERIACPLCGAHATAELFAERDLALGVPGRFPVARCERCGLLYQNPRVCVDELERMYPANYPPHARAPKLGPLPRDPGPAVRCVLAEHLGYRHLRVDDLRRRDRLAGQLRRRRIAKNFPPWIGRGRLLDVGCATGRFLQQMAAVGWEVSGIEFDAEAAATARAVTERIVVGDPVDASFATASFDVVTAFHVVEHLPEPRRALECMLRWLAPGGLLIIEVPNVAGWGGSLFGRYWSGLDYPRHLVHFTPATMAAMVNRAGGRIVDQWHWSKPRWITRSVRHALVAHHSVAARAALAALDSRLGRGVVKLVLDVALRPAGPARRGEVVRYFIRHSSAAPDGDAR
jgi:SAM-dependent methyltransferase